MIRFQTITNADLILLHDAKERGIASRYNFFHRPQRWLGTAVRILVGAAVLMVLS